MGVKYPSTPRMLIIGDGIVNEVELARLLSRYAAKVTAIPR
jgi:hypothetical protein